MRRPHPPTAHHTQPLRPTPVPGGTLHVPPPLTPSTPANAPPCAGPDDYTPAEGRYSSKWPEDWDKATIAQQAEECVLHYVEDWGWELHKYARLNSAKRLKKVLRYEIHLEAFDGYGKCHQVLNWQDDDFGQCALWWLAMHKDACGRAWAAKQGMPLLPRLFLFLEVADPEERVQNL